MNDTWPKITWDQFFMLHVYLVASKSKDPSTKVGSVIVRNNSVISEGYNGICRSVNDLVSERLVAPEKYYWFEHAERNSIFHCARHGISTEGTTLYTQGLPCSDCSRSIIQSGIKEIVVHEEWDIGLSLKLGRVKWQESCVRSDIMLLESGVSIRTLNGKVGCKTMVDGKIFEV